MTARRRARSSSPGRCSSALPASASASPGAAIAAAAKKKRCPPGPRPSSRAGRKAVPKRDRRGRLRCRAIPPAGRPAPARDAARPGRGRRRRAALRLASTPARSTRLRGPSAASAARKRLLDVTLTAGARSAGACGRPRRPAPQTATYAPGDGVDGKRVVRREQATGADERLHGDARAVSVTATRDGVRRASCRGRASCRPTSRAPRGARRSASRTAAGLPVGAGKRPRQGQGERQGSRSRSSATASRPW